MPCLEMQELGPGFTPPASASPLSVSPQSSIHPGGLPGPATFPAAAPLRSRPVSSASLAQVPASAPNTHPH